MLGQIKSIVNKSFAAKDGKTVSYVEIQFTEQPGKKYNCYQRAAQGKKVGDKIDYSSTRIGEYHDQSDGVTYETFKMQLIGQDEPEHGKKSGEGGPRKADPAEIEARHLNTVMMQASNAATQIIVAGMGTGMIKNTAQASAEFALLYRAFRRVLLVPSDDTHQEEI